MDEVALITGGAGGMGLATARAMSRDHAVALVDLGHDRVEAAAAALRSEGARAVGIATDVTSSAEVQEAFLRAESVGKVRAVVHTAGISPQMGDAKRIAEVNAAGTVNVVRAFRTRAAAGDALVAVASTAGHALPRVLLPTRAFSVSDDDPAKLVSSIERRSRMLGHGRSAGLAYALSKAFVIEFARAQAASFGAVGARVVSVSPGTFDTAMGRVEEAHGAAAFLEHAALKRFGSPEEIAAVLAFCASRRAGYLTGADILVDGGTRAGGRGRRSRGR